MNYMNVILFKFLVFLLCNYTKYGLGIIGN